MMERKPIRVWNLSLEDGEKIRIATIEKEALEYHKETGAILNEEEFLSEKFRIALCPAPEWLKEKAPRAEYLVTVIITDEGCIYWENGECMIKPNCPEFCSLYGCREDAEKIH